MSFYLLTIGHVNRAWALIGVSLRHAIALGLHLRNTATESVDLEQDTLTHTWWAAYCIETLLNAIMGRPPAITEEYCTVPLPNHESEEDASSNKSYLITRIEIARLTRKIQRYLYSPQTATQSWEVSSSHLLHAALIVIRRTYTSTVYTNDDLGPSQ